MNVAIERDYHFSTMLTNAEGRIGTFENRFAPMLRALRSGDEEKFPSDEITQFVRHLYLRLPRSREFVYGFAKPFLDAFADVFGNTPRKTVHHRNIQKAIASMIDEGTRLIQSREMNNKEAEDWLRRGLLDELTNHTHNNVLTEIQSHIASYDLVGQTRDNHTTTIIEQLQVQSPKDSEMVWRTVRADAGLILGDTGPLVLLSSGDLLAPISPTLPKPQAMILAISAERFLIGERSSRSLIPTAQEWNEATARFSKDFYIAKSNDDATASLIAYIGSKYEMPSIDDILKANPGMGGELLEEFRKAFGAITNLN